MEKFKIFKGKLQEDEDSLKQEEIKSQNPCFYADKTMEMLDENLQKIEDNQHDFLIASQQSSLDQNHLKKFTVFNPQGKQVEEFWNSKKEQFSCYQGIKQNLNENITKILEQLLHVYENQKDNGRTCAYRKAIAIIKSQTKQIKSIKDIENVQGIGIKIRQKIHEILLTGKLRKAENLMQDPKNKAIQILTSVWGIGSVTAGQLYDKGIKTIEDLKNNEHYLNDQQKIGLKYYDDLQNRMKRQEADQLISIVQKEINIIAGFPNPYEAIACGSYRRLKETNGDVDIIITRKDGQSFEGFLEQLIQNLETIGFLTDHLALPNKSITHHGSENYMGICQLDSTSLHRRIDIKIYPMEQFGYAVLYFTGSAQFNRSMRLFARKKGYSLSDHGLYPVNRIKNQKVWTGVNIPCYTEEDVFKVLQLDYKLPKERDL